MNGNEKYKSGPNAPFRWLNDIMPGQSGGASSVSAPSAAAAAAAVMSANSTASLQTPNNMSYYMDMCNSHAYRHHSGATILPNAYSGYPIEGFSQLMNPAAAVGQPTFDNSNLSQASTSSSLPLHQSSYNFMADLGIPQRAVSGFPMPSLGLPYNPTNLSYAVPAVNQPPQQQQQQQQQHLPSSLTPLQKVGNHTSQSSTPNSLSSQLKHDSQYTTLKPVNDKKYQHHQQHHNPKLHVPISQIDRRNENHRQNDQSKEKQQHKNSTSSKMLPADPALSLSKSVTQLTSPLHTDFYSPTSSAAIAGTSARNQQLKMAKAQQQQQQQKQKFEHSHARYYNNPAQRSASNQYFPPTPGTSVVNSSDISPFLYSRNAAPKFYEPNQPTTYGPSGQNRYTDLSRPSTTANEKMGAAPDNNIKKTITAKAASRNRMETMQTTSASNLQVYKQQQNMGSKQVEKTYSNLLSTTLQSAASTGVMSVDRHQLQQQKSDYDIPIPYSRLQADGDKWYKTQSLDRQRKQVSKMAEKIAKCQESDITPNEVKEKLGLREAGAKPTTTAADCSSLSTLQQRSGSPSYPFNQNQQQQQQQRDNNKTSEGDKRPPTQFNVPSAHSNSLHHNSKASSSMTTNTGVNSDSSEDHKKQQQTKSGLQQQRSAPMQQQQQQQQQQSSYHPWVSATPPTFTSRFHPAYAASTTVNNPPLPPSPAATAACMSGGGNKHFNRADGGVTATHCQRQPPPQQQQQQQFTAPTVVSKTNDGASHQGEMKPVVAKNSAVKQRFDPPLPVITKRKVTEQHHHNGVGAESPPPKKPHFDSGLAAATNGDAITSLQQDTTGPAVSMPSSHARMIRLTTTATTSATISSSSASSSSSSVVVAASTTTTTALSAPISSYPDFIVTQQTALSTITQFVSVAEFIQKDKKASSSGTATKSKRGRKPKARPNADVTTQQEPSTSAMPSPVVGNIKVENLSSPPHFMSSPMSNVMSGSKLPHSSGQLMAPPQTPSPNLTKLGKRVGRPPGSGGKKKFQQQAAASIKHAANAAKRTPSKSSLYTPVPRFFTPSNARPSSAGSSGRHLATKIISFKRPQTDPRKKAHSSANRRNPNQQQPLPPTPKNLKKVHCQAAVGQTLLHKSAQLGYVDNVTYYLENDLCKVNDKDNAGYTALHEACVTNQLAVAKELVQFDADVNANASCGTRPLHDAIEHNNTELVRFLLSCGADPSLNKYSGKGTHDLARTPAMRRLLDEYNRKLQIISKDDVDDERLWRWNLPCSKIYDHPDKAIGYDPFLAVPEDKTGQEMEFLVFKNEPPRCYYVEPLAMKSEKLRCTNYFKLDEVLKMEKRDRVDFMLDSGVGIKTVRADQLKDATRRKKAPSSNNPDQPPPLVDLVDCRSKLDKCKVTLFNMDYKTGRTRLATRQRRPRQPRKVEEEEEEAKIEDQQQQQSNALDDVRTALNFSMSEQQTGVGMLSPIHPSSSFVPSSSSPMKSNSGGNGLKVVKQEPSESSAHHHRHYHHHHHYNSGGMPRLNADPFAQAINFKSDVAAAADTSLTSVGSNSDEPSGISFEEFVKEVADSPSNPAPNTNHVEVAATNGVDSAPTVHLDSTPTVHVDSAPTVQQNPPSGGSHSNGVPLTAATSSVMVDYSMKCSSAASTGDSTAPSSDETSSSSNIAAASC